MITTIFRSGDSTTLQLIVDAARSGTLRNQCGDVVILEVVEKFGATNHLDEVLVRWIP
jgi:hypothetical protein